MSTRSIIEFALFDEGKKIRHVRIYKHTDGYPEGKNGMFVLLTKFLKWDYERLSIGDIEYLSANFVHWCKSGLEERNTKRGWLLPSPSLATHGNIGICSHEYFYDDHGAAYIYNVEIHLKLGKVIIKCIYRYDNKQVAKKIIEFAPRLN